MNRSLPVLLPLLAACGGSTLPPAKLEALGEATPRLPAPEAQVYATNLGTPGDPLVASQVGELPWEESLSGAAGALGVEAAGGTPPDPWLVRWTALRAGYPYPVEDFLYEKVDEGSIGERVIQALSDSAVLGSHVGLVRVRAGNGDYWVGLLARPRIALEPVPRELPVGGTVELRSAHGRPAQSVRVKLVSPAGELTRTVLNLGVSFEMDVAGEHWIELSDDLGVLASFPVAVGAPAEPAPPLAGLHLPCASPEELEDASWDLLDELRERYDWDPLRADPILASVARAHLADHLGHDGPESGAFRGAPGACRASLSCGLLPSTGAESCFQQWLVEPEARASLLDPRCVLVGLDSDTAEGRLWLQLELGEE